MTIAAFAPCRRGAPDGAWATRARRRQQQREHRAEQRDARRSRCELERLAGLQRAADRRWG